MGQSDFEAVIFDWDGTLADTKEVVVLSFQMVLAEVGCRISDRFLERLIGIGARNMFKEALESAGIPFDEKMINDLLRRKTSIQLGMIDRVRLFDGAIELLDSLHGRLRIALATMSNREVIEKAIAAMGIKKYFDLVLTVDEVKKPKPDPEVFLKCAEKLGVQPTKCVVIEDSVFGVIAAKRAGMRCIAVLTGAYGMEELVRENPDLTVKSLMEIEKILGFILG
ncbi:MAG: HAD family phosphatase [Nitrososphaerota archaeon]|nr:HAD family phosphatase [Candidatus Bathyarchaeota archaeon]MDW8048950.1 HAD family phosphatase [Nitrososphaerota archaeon]